MTVIVRPAAQVGRRRARGRHATFGKYFNSAGRQALRPGDEEALALEAWRCKSSSLGCILGGGGMRSSALAIRGCSSSH